MTCRTVGMPTTRVLVEFYSNFRAKPHQKQGKRPSQVWNVRHIRSFNLPKVVPREPKSDGIQPVSTG